MKASLFSAAFPTAIMLITAANLEGATIGINLGQSTNATTWVTAPAAGISSWANLEISVNPATYATRATLTNVLGTGIDAWGTGGDWWIASYGSTPKPWAGALGGKNIANFTGNQTVIQLSGLSTWLAANSAGSYKVTVYYSVRDGNFTQISGVNYYEGMDITAANPTFGTATATDTMGAFTNPGGTQWYATSALATTFQNDKLVLALPFLGTNYAGGVAAISLETVPIPESSTYALLGAIAAVGLVVVRRRRTQR